MSIGNLSKRIRIAREESEYSQRDLADILKVSDKTISAYESGRAAPPVEKLEKIARATSRPMSFFSEDKEQDYTIEAKFTQVEKLLLEIKDLLKKR